MRKYIPSLRNAKNYLSRIWNRQFFAFLFFLFLSAAFWLFQTLNETYDREIAVRVVLTDVPDNVVVTTEPPAHIRLTLRDRGFILLRYQYFYRKHFPAIKIKWSEVSTPGGHVTLPTAELLKPILSTLEGSTQLVGAKPESIEFFYNYGQSKEVPVVIQGKFEADSAYTLMATDVEPRTVMVYASNRILDTLSAAYLEPIHLHGLTDTTVIEHRFVKMAGVKYVPARPKLRILADRMVEKTVEVPVQGVNFPATKTLRTFPSKVKVTFQVGMSQYRKVTPESFVLTINYEDLLNYKEPLFPLNLKSTPYGVKRPRLYPAAVEYVIEEATSEETSD